MPSPKLCLLKIDDFVNFHFVTRVGLQIVFNETTVGEQNPLAAEMLQVDLHSDYLFTYLKQVPMGGPSSLFKLGEVQV